MGLVLLAGGLVGSTIGVALFALLRELGQIDVVIKLSFIIFLGMIGSLMLVESIRAIMKSRQPGAKRGKLHQHNWLHGLPFKMRFRKSKLYISALLPFGVGALVGVLSAIMGVGGGFIMVPAMIYLLGMPTKVVVGTSLFQIITVTAATTMMHAITNQTVDIVLAVLLLVGGVIGAQFGTRIGTLLKAEQLRILLALLVILVCAKLALDLLLEPSEIYSLNPIREAN